jgi:hypothetical protein
MNRLRFLLNWPTETRTEKRRRQLQDAIDRAKAQRRLFAERLGQFDAFFETCDARSFDRKAAERLCALRSAQGTEGIGLSWAIGELCEMWGVK